jgi:hypothetical protein
MNRAKWSGEHQLSSDHGAIQLPHLHALTNADKFIHN